MKHILTISLCFLALSLSAQETDGQCCDPDGTNYAGAPNCLANGHSLYPYGDGCVEDPDCSNYNPNYGCVSCGEGTYWDFASQKCLITNPTDTNLDGCTDLNDLMDILSAYGTCAVPDFPTLTDENINAAVDLWLSDESIAEDTYGHISDWDVSSVTNMNHLFYDAPSFNGDLSSWDISSVTYMRGMFLAASSFNGDLSSWDVSSVTDMNATFQSADSFNGDLSSWDVSSVTDMGLLFIGANNFNGDISSWDVSSVTDISNIFNGAGSFNGDLSSWDVSSVTAMAAMFYNASSFNGDISSWDVSSVTVMTLLFEGASALSEENQCLIHTSFSSNSAWPYDWSQFCLAVFNFCGDDIGHEGYDYSTVQIGEQCWFAENCRYLPVVSSSSAGSETSPYYYVYGYEGSTVSEAKATENYETYGVLYNWPAVMTEGICPSGWHIPSDAEFTQLRDVLGGWFAAGFKMKTSIWNGSNSSGFTGLPGGDRYSGGFNHSGSLGIWWSTSEYGSSAARKCYLTHAYSNCYQNSDSRIYGFSARCVRD
jgi:uncharacterized protein (TIGR02145 family)